MENPAAWHPDPTGAHDHRWWDGTRWTEHVADAGIASVDPLPGVPTSQSGTSDGTQELATTDADERGDDTAAGESTTAVDRPSQPVWGGAAGGRGASEPSWSDRPSRSNQPVWGQRSTGSAWGEEPRGSGSSGPQPASGLAITALVLGLLAIPLLLLAGLGVLFGIAAIVCGFVATSQVKRGVSGGRGLAIGGIVSGFVSLAIAAFVIVALVTFGAGFLEDFEQCLQETGSQAVCQERLQEEIMQRFGPEG